MHLSIEITDTQHQHLKAAATLQGQSIKDYVLERSIPNALSDIAEQTALKALEDFLQPSLKAAQNGELSTQTIDEIFDQVIQEYDEQ